MEAFTETFWEILFAVSEAVTVMVTLPDGAELAVETVRVAEPDPPVMVVLSKLAVMFVLEEEALSDTVPVKPFTAETLMAKVAELPAVITWEVGLADKQNSELLPPLPRTDHRTARRNHAAVCRRSIDMPETMPTYAWENLFPRPVPITYESNTFGLSLVVRCLPGKRKQLVKSWAIL